MKSTLRVKTLRLTLLKKALPLLGENAGLYGDNGGDPDGDEWLPSKVIDEIDTGVMEVIKNGWGEMVEACYYGSDDWPDITENLNFRGRALTPEHFARARGADEIEYEDVEEALLSAACVLGWAAFGVGDVIVVRWYDGAIDKDGLLNFN